jgi:hypothetical protein
MNISNLRVAILTKQDEIAEVRDPQTDELVGHMWVPRDEWVDLTPCVTSYMLRPEDLDYPDE